MHIKSKRRLNTIAVSVALALSAPAAFALPTIAPTQLPGNGAVQYGTATSSINTNTNTGTVSIGSGATVIDWGVSTGATLFSGSTTPGFNIGASAAVIFNNTSAGAAQVLNVDVTGNPTQIYGALSATADTTGSGFSPQIFVANANGIVVGNGATITVHQGLGLINADLSGSAAQSLATMGILPLSFQGATGGVSISAGADLHGIGHFLLVAGAGTVNIAGDVGTVATEPNVPLYINGGVGGYATTSGFTVADEGTASSLSTLTTSNYNNGFVYQDAPTTVNLNLGTTQSAYNLANGSMIGVNGDLNVSGNIANIAHSGISWTGTFTNTGILQSGTQSGVSLAPYAGSTYLSSYISIYNNTSMAAHGGFVNASGAILNAGSWLGFTGASFDNEGTINLGGASFNSLSIGATQGNITLGGTIDLINTGTSQAPNNPSLGFVHLYASSTAGQTVNINTALNNVHSGVQVYATNLNVNAPVSVVGFPNNPHSFRFVAKGSNNSSGAPVIGNVDVSSTGSISAGSVYISAANTGYQSVTNLTVDGSIAATAAGGEVVLGTNPTTTAMIDNVSGAGYISGDNIDFVNLIGSVNNITSSQILANGFQLMAGPSGSSNVSVSMVGNHPQGFNVKVTGNVVLDSGSTSTTSETGNGFQVTPPANGNSRLVVQATGNMLVNAGQGDMMTYGEFQVPGLVYLLANQSLTVNTTINNAYTTNAPVGYGVWLLSPVINDLYPIFTNGNSGVNFMNTNYGYANSINGANPAVMATENLIDTTPTGQNFPAPTVYFNTTGTVNGTVLPYFVNGKGYLQEMQTFLTLP